MKKILKIAAIVYVGINLLLAIVFFSAGGYQMIARPTMPEVGAADSLAADLTYLHDVVVANEKAASPEQTREFSAFIQSVAEPGDIDALNLIALRALAIFDNAHTTVLKTRMYRLPVRFHWTSDALIIVKARPEYAGLLGRRVLSFGGKTPESLVAETAVFTGGGTASWRRYRSEFLFSAPSALAVMGVPVSASSSVELQLVNAEGVQSTLSLSADSELMPGDPFWDFRHGFPGDTHFDTEGWQTLLSKDDQLPLYLQATDKLHLARALEAEQAVYVRMNASFADASETLDAFEQRILRLVDEQSARNIVVDFRFNRGGDYTKILPIVKSLSAAVPESGRLYLLVGANTFSAGIIAASQFKRYIPAKLTVVGSEMGDSLRFRAEGFYPTLPSSGVKLYLTKAWTDLVNGCGWLDDCWPPNKVLLRKVGSLTIDIPVANTWDDYRNRKDRVLAAVRSDIARRSAGAQE